MLIDPDEWEGLAKLEQRGVRTFRARAYYKSGFTKLYSPYYDVIIATRGQL